MKKNLEIPPEAYGRDYFLSNYLEGYEEFKAGRLSARQAKEISLLAIENGFRVLDIGFGRGEVLYRAANLGAVVSGVDYSKNAHEIAGELLRDVSEVDLRLADCRQLPFVDNYFDRVFSGDVIEHVDSEGGVTMLKEAFRVLKPGGFLLIHTSPNTIFTKFTYFLIRPILKIINQATVLAMEDHFSVMKKFHVHEYNLFSLKKAAKRAGLKNVRVWLDRDLIRSGEHRFTRELKNNFLVKSANFFGRLAPVRFFLGNDLYLKCYKK